MIRLLIADDHAVVRQGVRQMLALDPGLHVVDEATNGWEVIEKTRAGGFDLLLMDMTMPGPNGVELVKRVRDEAPDLPILVFTMHGESQIASRALKAGAAGYLTKDIDPPALLAAVRKVAAGGRYLDPAIAEKLVFEGGLNSDEAPHERLSDREFQIFQALVEGHTVNDIAERLHLSAKTVSTHKTRIQQKLNLATTADLVRYAISHGLSR